MSITRLLLCGSILAASVAGQSTVNTTDHARNELNLWGGIALAPITAFSGITPQEAAGRKFFIIGVGYARTVAATRSLALQYTIDAIPMVIATNDIRTTAAGPRATAYGFGLMPLGLRLSFRNSNRVRPFVEIGAGGLLFDKPVPLPDAGKFAFALEGGGGLRFGSHSRRAVSIGVKLHHISNGNRSGSNRGLNQLVFFTGLSFS